MPRDVSPTRLAEALCRFIRHRAFLRINPAFKGVHTYIMGDIMNRKNIELLIEHLEQTP